MREMERLKVKWLKDSVVGEGVWGCVNISTPLAPSVKAELWGVRYSGIKHRPESAVGRSSEF